MICPLSNQTPAPVTIAPLKALLSVLPDSIVEQYGGFLNVTPKLLSALSKIFENPPSYSSITPMFIYNEYTNEMVTILAKNSDFPQEPGEPGSVLSFVRANGYTESFMCSDCYGQLSCSSCAIEVLAGTLENPTPREEEYDMLDIDDQKPPTQYTRLGCQSVVGRSPLVIKIRAPQTVA